MNPFNPLLVPQAESTQILNVPSHSFPLPQVQVGKLELNVGPSELTAVVFRQQSWRMFDFGFLKIWGGRYAPAIKKRHQWSRWFTSIFVHESFNHVLSNMLLWLVLGLYLVRGLGFKGFRKNGLDLPASPQAACYGHQSCLMRSKAAKSNTLF